MFLLPLQAHALINAHCPAWLAWLVSVIFVLLESAVMDVIFFAIVLPFFQDAIFDATLRARGLSRMFDTRVEVNGMVLCCRGVSSGLLLAWFLVLAQVRGIVLILRESSRAKSWHTHSYVDCGLDCYCSSTPDSRSGYRYCLLYQRMARLVSTPHSMTRVFLVTHI